VFAIQSWSVGACGLLWFANEEAEEKYEENRNQTEDEK
jgi:hypothetical protein